MEEVRRQKGPCSFKSKISKQMQKTLQGECPLEKNLKVDNYLYCIKPKQYKIKSSNIVEKIYN